MGRTNKRDTLIEDKIDVSLKRMSKSQREREKDLKYTKFLETLDLESLDVEDIDELWKDFE